MEGDKPMTKSQLKKLERERKKAEIKAKKAAERQQAEDEAKKLVDVDENFKRLSLNQSQNSSTKEYTNIKDLDASRKGQVLWFRARVHATRAQGNICFLELRQQTSTVQSVIAKSEEMTKEMVNFAKKVPKESIVDVQGEVAVVDEPVTSTSQQDVELQMKAILLVSEAQPTPVAMEDLSRNKSILDKQKKEIAAIDAEIKTVEGDSAQSEKLKELQEKKETAQKYPKIKRSKKLDNRILDLRTTANQGVFRVQSAIGQLFREFLLKENFVEIHTPKIIGCASEGGSEVFQLDYFGKPAFLAQSPQLYKQMAICGDMNRVFEIGPVFRAENSKTHRHLTEFVGLDLEMAFHENYHEVLDVMGNLFVYMFEALETRFASELKSVNEQFPFEPLKFKNPSLVLDWNEGISLLRGAGVEIGDFDDMNTAQERTLGALVREKYDTDFFILDKFPLAIRPFYTMPSPTDKTASNSYDLFIRGEEICSGAQRIHDPELLLERAKVHEVTEESIQPYIDAFKYGAPPHAGGGVGLERVAMLYMNLGNIRATSMFPRDPLRTAP